MYVLILPSENKVQFLKGLSELSELWFAALAWDEVGMWTPPSPKWRTGKLFTATRPAPSFVVFVMLNTSWWDNTSPERLQTISHVLRSLQLYTCSTLFRLCSFWRIQIWHFSQPLTSPYHFCPQSSNTSVVSGQQKPWNKGHQHILTIL